MRPELKRDIDLIANMSAVQRILNVVSASTGLRFAAVARVTSDEWIACAVLDTVGLGLAPGSELDVTTTLCETVRDSGRLVVMNDAPNDALYKDHHTPKLYGFRSYISVPILRHGEYFGTLCALDPEPALVNNDKIIGMFTLFAELISHQLEQEDAHARALLEAQRQAELREQFIAVLGHDLRSPLAAIQMSAQVLGQGTRDDRDQRATRRIVQSSQRIEGLVDDVMDFARVRLGSGFDVSKKQIDLDVEVRRVVDERASVHPDRAIDVVSEGDLRLVGDPLRLGQLVANLVGNAIEHSASDARVTVTARGLDDTVEIIVHNEGAPIDAALLGELFRPFFRGRADAGRKGLGLGLYIASQIADAHGGTLRVASDDGGTTFTATLPR